MNNKRNYKNGLIISTIPLLVGLFLVYRGNLSKDKMIVVSGKVLSKKLDSIYTFKGGQHYFLAFQIENLTNKIAISYATEDQAKIDSAINLIDVGKSYTFYIDPTYPKTNKQNNGIEIIEYNGFEIYRSSQKDNLYAGIFFTLMGLALFVLTVKTKKVDKTDT